MHTQILDSWVWIGGETLLVDQKPNATATVNDPVSCANPFETLDSAGSYDPDPEDTGEGDCRTTAMWHLVL